MLPWSYQVSELVRLVRLDRVVDEDNLSARDQSTTGRQHALSRGSARYDMG